MTENMAYMQAAINEMNYCLGLLRIYEAGTMQGPSKGEETFEVTLTPTQINQLKSRFASSRTAGIAAWQAITAS